MSSKKPHPRNYERIARKQALWLEQARARAEMAQNEVAQLRAQLESIHRAAKGAQGNLEKIAIVALGALHGER